MTNPHTPTPSNSVVTEAMIEAGVKAMRSGPVTRRNSVRAIYLAMQSANPTGSDELVERNFRDEAAKLLRDERDAYRERLVIPGMIDSPQLSPNDCWAYSLRAVEKALRANAIATPDTDRVAVLTEALEETSADLCNLQCRQPGSDDPANHTPGCNRARAALSQPLGSQENSHG